MSETATPAKRLFTVRRIAFEDVTLEAHGYYCEDGVVHFFDYVFVPATYSENPITGETSEVVHAQMAHYNRRSFNHWEEVQEVLPTIGAMQTTKVH